MKASLASHIPSQCDFKSPVLNAFKIKSLGQERQIGRPSCEGPCREQLFLPAGKPDSSWVDSLLRSAWEDLWDSGI